MAVGSAASNELPYQSMMTDECGALMLPQCSILAE